MKRGHVMTLLGCSILMACMVWTSAALAQQVIAEDSRKKLFLSLDEAINLVLENNLDIRIEQYNPEIKKEAIKAAEAGFNTEFTSGSSQVINETTDDRSPSGITGLELGIGKRFQSGGMYEFGIETSRSTFDDMDVEVTDPATGETVLTTTSVDDSYSSSVNFTISQALMKNRGKTVNTAPIVIARKNRELSVSQLRATVMQIVSQVKTSYWDLILARGDLEAKRLSLQLAYDLVKINQAQVDVGTLAPIEILQAQATAAAREVEIISAEQEVRDVEDTLKRLLDIPDTDPVWEAAIVPTDQPLATFQPVSLEESVQLALENREELYQVKKGIEMQELAMDVSQHQLLPELNLFSQFSLTGTDKDWPGSLGEMPDFDNFSVTIGANFTYSFGNNAAESDYAQNKLELEQSRLSLRNLEQQIIVQVREAIRGVETTYRLVEATKIAQQLAEQQLDAEQKKFNEGLSTNFQVLSYQESLASAQSRHTQAITNYNKALVGLDILTGVLLQQHNIVINDN